MKKVILRRAVCALLILLMLFSTLSCSRKEDAEPEYNEDLDLDIIIESIAYSDEFIENANVRFAKIAHSLAESYFGVPLSDKQKQSISSEFKKTIIPMAYRVRIYEGELDNLLSSFEDYLEDTEELISVFDLYERCLYEIGSQRSGYLAYEISLEFVKRKENDAREKYFEHEYDWYLEDAERCSSLLDSLELMGKEKFTSIISMLTFLTSLAKSNALDADDDYMLSGADILCIMDQQGKLFESNDLTEDDYAVFGALTQEVIPKKGDTLSSAMLYTLKNNEYFPNAFRIMPAFISLYADVTAYLNEKGIIEEDSGRDECARALAIALIDSESSLSALDTALKNHAASESTTEKDVINSFAPTTDVANVDIEAIDLDSLMTRLQEIADTESISAFDTLQSTFISYIYGIAPYITLAFLI